jgi:hypothetical protein
MEAESTTTGSYSVFLGAKHLCTGPLNQAITAAKAAADSASTERLAVFDNSSGLRIDFDFRGSLEDVTARLEKHPMLSQAEKEALKPRGPGRPKLGVIAREVTLLPRHWDWLAEQPGGASVALRKLVEMAKRENQAKDLARKAQEASHRFMWDMAGDQAGFEEASRAFYARDYAGFEQALQAWPEDVRTHALWLVARQRELESLATETN